MKLGRNNISSYYSWGSLENAVVNKNLTSICGRHVGNYPKYFNGFPLRVFLFEEDPVSINWKSLPNSFSNSALGRLRKWNPLTAGYNGLAIAGLAEYLNFTPEYILPEPPENRYAFKNEDGIIMGSGRVVYSQYDFVGMIHFVTGHQGMDYEFLQPLHFDKYCVIVRKARRIPLYLASMRCFTATVFFFILTIPWLSTFFLKILNKFKPYKVRGLYSSKPYFIIVLFCFVLVSIPMDIRTKSTIERWIISGSLVFSIIFYTIFSGNLTSHITADVRFSEINSLKDLADSNLKIVTNSPFMMKILFGDITNVTDPVILKLTSNVIVGNDSLIITMEGDRCTIRQKLDFEMLNVSAMISLIVQTASTLLISEKDLGKIW